MEKECDFAMCYMSGSTFKSCDLPERYDRPTRAIR